ncbi:MAG: transglycosylase domain-containing protein, partial [Micrococcales bacterium]|nr:transglycosylase domain-containing protein [Micrococcales bacterium]
MHLGKRLYSLLLFFVVSAVAGLLVAGLFVPAVAAAATGSTSGAQGLESLPAELSTPPQAERSRLLNADGSVLANFYDENRVIEPLANIAPIMQQAQVAIEDTRFYQHGAIDLQGTLRAAVANFQGIPQGGSGITQQVVRLIQVETATANNDP